MYTYSCLTFYVKHEYGLWGCMVKVNVGNDKIRLLWCHQCIPLTKYSSIHNMYVYVYLLQLIVAAFPLLHDERGGPPLSYLTQNMPVWPLIGISCYKHIYTLLPCSCAFVSSLFHREYVNTPFRMYHLEGIFLNWSKWPCPRTRSVNHAFSACSHHLSNSPNILLGGNTALYAECFLKVY